MVSLLPNSPVFLYMMAKEDSARDSFCNSTLELTREQPDRGYNRDAFWSDFIAQLFNDASYNPSALLQEWWKALKRRDLL